jgi:hypothetical protein
MLHSRFFRLTVIALIASLVIEALFSALPPTQAQGDATPQATASTAPSADDSDELPILLSLSGRIQEITATSIRINDMVVLIPAGTALPAGIRVGVVITIRANLRNDDTLTIITVMLGTPTPTPEPTDEATDEPTDEATAQATPLATAVATTDVTPITVVIPGCDKPKQQLAVLVSTTFDVSYAEVVGWRCKGFTFGVIARAYLLVITGEDEGKNLTVAIILNLRAAGKRWSLIIIELDVHPQPEDMIIAVSGGQVVIVANCQYLKKHSKKFYNKYCKKPKKPKKKK